MITETGKHTLQVLWGFLIGGAVLLVLVHPGQAQPSALQEGKEASEFGEYEKAASLLSEVTQDSSVEETYRRDAFEYLVRAHIAEGQRSKARTAMKTWLQMEPPPVELDPNRQPPDLMKLHYEVRKEMSGNYAVQRDPGLQTLAIMDFTNASVTDSQRWGALTAGFPSMMIDYLSGTTDLQVIERQRIDWLLKELELQRKGDVVDQSTAVRTGKVLGATSVLFGTYTVLEDRIRIGARLVKVETSEILLAEDVMGDPDNFFELVQDLSNKVTRAINVELEETKTGAGPETQSIEARLAYFDGLVEMDDGNYQAARKHFEDALEHDSEYERARRKMKSLDPQLAAAKAESSDSPGSNMRDDRNR
jgi:TolB-like protein